MSEAEKKKTNVKFIIIPIVVILIILIVTGLAVGGFFLFKFLKLNKPLSENWANIYYNYLKDVKKESTKDESQNNTKVGFMDVEDIENPVMAITHDNKYTDLYYIDDNNVKQITNSNPSSLVYLYNIELKKYGWYVQTSTDVDDTYSRVLEIVLDNKLDSDESTEKDIKVNEYKFTKDETISVTTVEDETISIPKFDTVFVDTDVDLTMVDYNNQMTDEEFKNAIIEGVDKYKSEEEILTEDLKKSISDKENKSISKQEEIKKAEEDVKKAEAIKISQDNVISKIGEHLKYFTGCYRGSIYGISEIFDINNVDVSVPGVNKDYEMVYEVKGLSSISSLNSSLNKYIDSNIVSKLKNSSSGDITKYLHDYNGKVYFAIGGVGDSSYIKYKNATVVSSKGDTSTVQLVERNAFTDDIEHRINITVKYNEETESYKIVDYTLN